MATTTMPLLPIKAEHHPSPPPPQPLETTPPVKQEPQHQPKTPQNHRTPQQQQLLPHLTNSVSELRHLSSALSAFHRRYDELQEHLDFIRTSIDAKLLQLLDTDTEPSPPQPTKIVPVAETLTSDPAKTTFTETLPSDAAKSTVTEPSISERTTENNNQSARSAIEQLCRDMCSRSLRKYIVSNLCNVAKLRKEVPVALKFAANPAKLVMDCFGRFFLQGSKAYEKASPMITSRQASVLALEFFLLMGCNSSGIETAVKEEAESAAVEWRRRLVSEGGVSKACEVDARGLLLLIGCFGIPKAFKNDDVRDLILASSAIEISDALRRSDVLLARIPEIIEWMIKNKMEVEAVDIVYTFGMESRFPPEPILTSFLQESKETWKKSKQAAHAQGSSAAVNIANKKNLAEMKAVLKCLECHKIDPLKALPGRKLNETISKLEKDIADLDKRIGELIRPKRKADKPESSKRPETQEVKRPRFPGPIPEQQNPAAYVDHKGSFDGSTPLSSFGGGFPLYSNYSPYSSVQHGSGAGPSLGTGTRLLGAAMSSGAGAVLPAGSYSGVHGGVLVDRVEQVMNGNGQPYGFRGEPFYRERLVGRSYAEPAALGTNNGMYRATPSLEGFVGLPNSSSVGVSSRSSTSDLYQFADAIVEREYASSRTAATVPPRVAPAHHPSYLY